MVLAKLQVVTCILVPLAGGAQAADAPPLGLLLERHVPILVLHPAEQFAPVRVDGFLADSDLVGSNLDQRFCQAIEGPAASPCYASAEASHGSPPVVYGKAFRTKTRIDLQYWIWYPFNDYSSTVPPGDVWQVHEGDWESVSVILDLAGRPLVVGLSKHCEGTRRAWPGVRKQGGRPVVYVGLGSHANYFAAGTFKHSPICWPRELRDVVRALNLVDRTAAGRTVRPTLVPVTATRPSWVRFAGRWGESGYVHFPNNDPIAHAGAPRSPAFQDTWRAPVKEELGWPRG